MTPISVERVRPRPMVDQSFPITSAGDGRGVADQRMPRPRFASPAAESVRDQTFIGLLDAFRAHGGLLRGNELAGALTRTGKGDHSKLARMIVAGQLVCFEWGGDHWLPAFQLEGYSLDVRGGVARVIAELSGILDGWETAIWFVTSNAALQGRAPVEAVQEDADEVVNAARIDRFIVTG